MEVLRGRVAMTSCLVSSCRLIPALLFSPAARSAKYIMGPAILGEEIANGRLMKSSDFDASPQRACLCGSGEMEWSRPIQLVKKKSRCILSSHYQDLKLKHKVSLPPPRERFSNVCILPRINRRALNVCNDKIIHPFRLLNIPAVEHIITHIKRM